MKKLIVFLLLLPILWVGQSEQEQIEILPIYPEKNRVMIMLGHVFIPKALNLAEGQGRGVALPVWSIGYNYHLHEKWVIGLHTDITVQSFEVERGSKEAQLDRSYPIAPTLMVGHRVLEHGTILVGGGYEIE